MSKLSENVALAFRLCNEQKAIIESLSSPVSEDEFDEYFHLQYGCSRDVATVNDVNAMITSRVKRHGSPTATVESQGKVPNE